MSKTFKQYRDEWMPGGQSDTINYCMPVHIGVIAQETENVDLARLNEAVGIIMKQLIRWFGRFSAAPDTPSHNQLILMTPGKSQISEQITELLKQQYGAKVVHTDEENIKKYCWFTIAAWDGIPDMEEPVYQTIRGILSTADTSSDDYKLRFPENRPIFQIVLPDREGTLPEINYKVREIYPHMLETINVPEPWFSRKRFIDPTLMKKQKDSKRRNFKSNAKKIKKFNSKIISFSKTADSETENIYDLLPWHHRDGKPLPACANIANLREIYYDIISMKSQTSQNNQNRILMILAVLAFGFFSAYSDLEAGIGCLIAYLVFIAAAYLFYWIFIKGTNAHNKYLEFRALAEGMRVQCYWYAADINESVGDNYTVKFQKDMLWATQAFKAWHVTDYLLKDNGDGTYILEAASLPGYVPDNLYIETEWLGIPLKKNSDGVYVPNLPENLTMDFYYHSPEQLNFYTSRIRKFSQNSHCFIPEQ